MGDFPILSVTDKYFLLGFDDDVHGPLPACFLLGVIGDPDHALTHLLLRRCADGTQTPSRGHVAMGDRGHVAVGDRGHVAVRGIAVGLQLVVAVVV